MGLNVTDTLQLLPGLSVLTQCALTANTDGDAVSIVMNNGAPVFLLPAFLIFTVLGLLVFPMVVLVANDTVVVLSVTFGGIGVAVAVGVAVGVAPA